MRLIHLISIRNNTWKVALTIFILTSTSVKAATSGRIGGNGGQPQSISCSQNTYAVGMRVKHDNQVIISVKLMCRAVNGNTGRATGPIRVTIGSRFSRPDVGLINISNTCPDGQFLSNVVKGFEGKVLLAKVVSGLSFQCVRYSNVNTSAGTSVRALGQNRQVGAKFNGPVRTAGDYNARIADLSLTSLAVRSGYALDSVMVNAKKMPWVTASGSNPQGVRLNKAVGVRPATPQLPDYYVGLKSDLWRYIGQTNYLGTIYRRVPASFCRRGMKRKNNESFTTKTFTLPDIQYEIINAGNDSRVGTTISEQFVRTIPNITIPPLSSGQRYSATISRGRIQRCVVGISGCSECSGSDSYQDPTLRIRVDPGNTLRESNEHNNVLNK